MSFGQFHDIQRHSAPRSMSEINVTPLVDVMLVLLVIFIITAPLLTHSIRLELPQAGAGAAASEGTTIHIAVDAAGRLYWEGRELDFAELESRFAIAARQPIAPEIQLRADKATRYEILAQVMAAAQAPGLRRIVFVTRPGADTAVKN